MAFQDLPRTKCPKGCDLTKPGSFKIGLGGQKLCVVHNSKKASKALKLRQMGSQKGKF